MYSVVYKYLRVLLFKIISVHVHVDVMWNNIKPSRMLVNLLQDLNLYVFK